VLPAIFFVIIFLGDKRCLFFFYLILFHFLGIGFDGCQYITNDIPTNTGLAAQLSSSGIL
jgi:hypothetical protein